MRWPRLLLGTLLLAALAPLGWIALNSRDLPGVDDADLAVDPRAAAPPNDLGLRLDQLARRLAWIEGRDDELAALAEQEPVDRHAAAALLPARAFFHDVARALALPGFRLEGEGGLSRDELARLAGWQRIARLLVLRARMRADSGDFDGALVDARSAIRLGRRIEDADGAALVHGLLAISIRDAGLRAIAVALPHTMLDAAASRRIAAEIASARSDPRSWSHIGSVEYAAARQRFETAWRDALASGVRLEPDDPRIDLAWQWLPRPYFAQHNRSLAHLAQRYRTLARPDDSGCQPPREPPAPSRGDPRERLRLALSPNGLGELLLAQAVPPDLDAFRLRRCAGDARVAATQLMVALKAHRDERLDLPDTLDELTPIYIETVPPDPFSGEAPHYAPTRRLLYSPGSDAIDAHGQRLSGAPEYVEPAWPLAF